MSWVHYIFIIKVGGDIMKSIIVVFDDDPVYSKKFVNLAIKSYGKKYVFLTFSSIKALKEYANENFVEALIVGDEFTELVEDIKVNSFYILNEKDKKNSKVGKRTYVYKLQNVKTILELVDKDISVKYENKNQVNRVCKILTFYSPVYLKNKIEILKKLTKYIPKNRKALIVDLDEFENYKGGVGLSNLIFDYKKNNLNKDIIKKEITIDKDTSFIKSVTYPEDFNVISYIDLANIVNELTNLDYDYIFINSDLSYVKSQYIINDSDYIVLIKDKDIEKFDKFKNYINTENQIDIRKILEFDLSKADKSYFQAFSKQYFGSDDV